MAKMSKAQYVLLTNTLAKAYANARIAGNWPFIPDNRLGGIRLAADAIADALERDNPSFDRKAFMDAIVPPLPVVR